MAREQHRIVVARAERRHRHLHRRQPSLQRGRQRGDAGPDRDAADAGGQPLGKSILCERVQPVRVAQDRGAFAHVERRPGGGIAQVDRDRRPRGPWRGGVDRERCERSAASGGPCDGDARGGRRDAADQRAHPLHRRTVAEQAGGFGSGGLRRCRHRGRPAQDRPLDTGEKVRVAPRLHREIARARLHRRDRDADAAVRGQHDDAGGRIVRHDPREAGEALFAARFPRREIEIEQDRIVAPRREARHRLFRPLGPIQPVAGHAKGDVHRAEHRRIVVDQQNRPSG